MSRFQFSVFSGGTVSFDLDTCAKCETKACVAACNVPNLACVLELRDGLPALKVTPEQAARGACIECLACELACATDGIGGIDFSLPMPELDREITTMLDRGDVPSFMRGM
jgi:NAD-dependent dihydropyrimidine dehydrogenase PreA subunit